MFQQLHRGQHRCNRCTEARRPRKDETRRRSTHLNNVQLLQRERVLGITYVPDQIKNFDCIIKMSTKSTTFCQGDSMTFVNDVGNAIVVQVIPPAAPLHAKSKFF
jgi:hypothetical protein